MVSIRNDKTGEGEIDRSQSSIDSYWKISDKCKIFMRNRSNFVLIEPEFNRACTQIVVFARMAREWLCTASTSAATCSGGVNWLMP